jgi:iron complex outermembrane receptor protein
LPLVSQGQPAGGRIAGQVTLAGNAGAVRNASVVLTPTGRRTQTADDGSYAFDGVAPGNYTLMAHMHALTDEKKTVSLAAGQSLTVNFELKLAAVHDTLTVTAEGQEVAAVETFQTVTSLEGYELTTRSSSTSLGELLENETGVAKRSSGPGSSRPVIRGFDGDRVLVMQDGIRTGTLSSQSGDHGEPVDATSADRIEVVRGPATLLYGSNAVGGVVNVLTSHHIFNDHPHEGLHATLSAVGGTANAQGGGSGSFEYGHEHYLVYGGGGGMRTGDYRSPAGTVANSSSDMTNTYIGFGHFGDRIALNFTYGAQQGNYGVPTNPASAGEGPVRLDWSRWNVRGNLGVKRLSHGLEEIEVAVNLSDWNHKEMDAGVLGTQFFNRQFVTRATVRQSRRGPWSGSFGAFVMSRDYKAVGAEALTPPVAQTSAAGFVLEELEMKRLRVQVGVRVERNGYSPDGLTARSFTGVSAAGGAIVPLWKDGALVANISHSYRAPALEELYNHGPHPGNNAWEIGDQNLEREASQGYEIALRHTGHRLRQEVNLFRNQMQDFVYLQPTGAVLEALPVARYLQAGARFLGAEAKTELRLREPLWLMLGFDAVDANLTAPGRANLPRIPPVRGRAGVLWTWKSLTVQPEAILANRQWQTASNETSTAGYTTFGLTAGYSIAKKHTMHSFQVTVFNLGDRLYRNHLSFIKAFAPEIGRGARIGYTFNWF